MLVCNAAPAFVVVGVVSIFGRSSWLTGPPFSLDLGLTLSILTGSTAPPLLALPRSLITESTVGLPNIDLLLMLLLASLLYSFTKVLLYDWCCSVADIKARAYLVSCYYAVDSLQSAPSDSYRPVCYVIVGDAPKDTCCSTSRCGSR